MAGNPDDAVIVFNGMPYVGWNSFRIEQSFDKATGQGSIEISPQPGQPFPIKLGASCTVLLGSAAQPVITGYVHEVNGDLAWGNHVISLTLFDKTKDAVDSTIGPGNSFKPPVKLKQVMDKTLKNMGLSDIQVVDEANPDEYTHAEVPVGEVDQTGFNWFDSWAKKRPVVLGTDGEGNFKIQRNMKKRGAGRLISLFEDSPRNNVLHSRFKNSAEDRFNKTHVAGQHSPNDLDHWEKQAKGDKGAQPGQFATKWGSATDTGVRPQRQKHQRGGKGLSGGSPKKTAKWRSNLARSRGFQYVATVQGFEMAPGQLWWPGFIIPVIDQHWEISDELFIVDVRYHKDWGKGATTEITLTHNDAYSESEAGPKGSRTASRGTGTADTGSYPEADDTDVQPTEEDPQP
jgi:prophage tail gpP-like protein